MNRFNHATRIISGYGALAQLGSEVQRLGVHRVLVLTDSFLCTTEHYQHLLGSLTAANIAFDAYTAITPDPSAELCDSIAAQAKESGAELLIGFGGGSSMDTAKAVAMLIRNGGKCTDWDCVPIPKPMLPVICIPTTAGTGSEVTFVAVITDKARQYKMSLMDEVTMVPTLAICDPALTLTLPKSLTASCGMDALTHAIEAYIGKAATPFTDAIALQAIRLISGSILIASKDGADRDARANLMLGSTLAGIAFINANVGAVHALAETVGPHYHIAHGLANAVFLPYVLQYNLPDCVKRLADVGDAMGLVRLESTSDQEHAEAALAYIFGLCKALEIPKISELGIPPEDMELIAGLSANNSLSADNAREIDKAGYLNILECAFNP